MASVYIDFYRFCDNESGDSSTMASVSHLLTAVDVAGQLQENNDQFDPSWR